MGALPFDVTRPTALMRPDRLSFTDRLPDWAPGDMPAVTVAETVPEPAVHRARIATALRRLRDPAADLHKVVLARALRIVADGPIDVGTLVRRLAEDVSATAYFVDLDARRGGDAGTALIGASPELLVARRGDVRDVPPVRRVGATVRRPRDRRGERGRARGVGQEPARAPTGGRPDARGPRTALRRPGHRAVPRAEPHVGGVASEHPDHGAAA